MSERPALYLAPSQEMRARESIRLLLERVVVDLRSAERASRILRDATLTEMLEQLVANVEADACVIVRQLGRSA